jgi:hypothetical protein
MGQFIEIRDPGSDPLAGMGLNVFPQQNKGDEHGRGIKIKMDTPLGQLNQTIKIGGQGSYGNQGIHGRIAVPESGEAPSENRKSPVKNYRRGHEPKGIGEIPDHFPRKIPEKTKIEGHGDHHDIRREDRGDPQTQDHGPLFPGLSRILFEEGGAKSQSGYSGHNFRRGQKMGKILYLDQIREKRDLRLENALGSAQDFFNKPGTCWAPHSFHFQS